MNRKNVQISTFFLWNKCIFSLEIGHWFSGAWDEIKKSYTFENKETQCSMGGNQLSFKMSQIYDTPMSK